MSAIDPLQTFPSHLRTRAAAPGPKVEKVEKRVRCKRRYKHEQPRNGCYCVDDQAQQIMASDRTDLGFSYARSQQVTAHCVVPRQIDEQSADRQRTAIESHRD